MTSLVLHPQTQMLLHQFEQNQPQATVLLGPKGIGKTTVAQYACSRLLETTLEKLEDHPYFKKVAPIDGRTIKIEAIRELEHFLSLRVPAKNSINRVVLIVDADTMSEEAQNALLKTLEEPPAGTVLVLTAAYIQSLLPTIRSRSQVLQLTPPAIPDVVTFFKEQGYDEHIVKKMVMLTGGLPGLMRALLDNNADHPLVTATDQAREILQMNLLERLVQVDRLSKDKELALNVLFILQQMADVSLQKAPTDSEQFKRWHTILSAAFTASNELRKNVQPKLVLTKLMLAL